MAGHLLPVQSPQPGHDVPAQHASSGQAGGAARDSGRPLRSVPAEGPGVDQQLL